MHYNNFYVENISESSSLFLQIHLNYNLNIFPLRLYFKNCKAKLEFGLGQGKKIWDKRHDIKNKETKRRIDRKIRGVN